MAKFDRNLIVIGGGAAGLVASYTAAAAGARVSLIERDRMGGDCLNTGCVPSKALLRAARYAADLRRGGEFGFRDVRGEVDFPQVMARVREAVQRVEPHDSVERYRSLGVDCIAGEARVVSPHEVEVNGRTLTCRSLIIATGAHPAIPAIPGLCDIDYLSSDSLWDLRELPQRLLILGGGPIGCELGQAFARLGAEVSLVELADRLLMREDPAVSETVADALAQEEVSLYLGHKALTFKGEGGAGKLRVRNATSESDLSFDRVLVAVGRRADTEVLGMTSLGVEVRSNGTLVTDAFLRTTVKGIFACGDVSGPFQLTHAAGRQGWYAAMNALFGGLWKFRIDYRAMPYAIYTEPEVARVGLNRQQAQERGIDFESTRYDLAELDRAIAERENAGFVEVLTAPGRDRILGASLVGAHAADLVGQFTAAMQQGYGLKRLLATIQPYPSFAEAPVLLAGQWQKSRLSPRLLDLSRRYLNWLRR